MTTHEYYIKHKEELLRKHKEWVKKNPHYSRDYFRKNREKINARVKKKREGKVYLIPRWSNEELEILYKNYAKKSRKELLNLLKRSWQSIQAKALRIGLSRNVRVNLGKNNGMWKGGVQYQYYRRIAFENLPSKCAICGLWFPKLEVHHKDKNPRNNVLSNLQIVCSPCHKKIHNIKPQRPKINRKFQRGTKRMHKKGWKK